MVGLPHGSPEELSRRSFIRRGIIGGAILLVGGTIPIALRDTRLWRAPRTPLKFLTPVEYSVLSSIAARVVPGPGARAAWPSAEKLHCASKADALLSRAHPAIGREFKQLLRLFENGLLGMVTMGTPTPFSRLLPAEQDARLERWRRSRVSLFRTGYQALVRLCHAVYFSSPEIYPLLGYPGPPAMPGAEQ